MTDSLAANAKAVFAKSEPPAPPEATKCYVDGSGSMFNPNNKTNIPAMGAAGAALLEVPKKGTPVDVVFFGNDALIPYTFKDKTDYQTLQTKLDCGTSLAPIAHDIAQQTAGGKNKHFVVVSDGDIGDYNESQLAFAKTLKENKGATIDIIIMSSNGYKTQVQHMMEELSDAFPSQLRITTADLNQNNCAHAALESALGKLPSPPAAAAQPPKQGLVRK